MFQTVWGGRAKRPQQIGYVGFIDTLQGFGLLNLKHWDFSSSCRAKVLRGPNILNPKHWAPGSETVWESTISRLWDCAGEHDLEALGTVCASTISRLWDCVGKT